MGFWVKFNSRLSIPALAKALWLLLEFEPPNFSHLSRHETLTECLGKRFIRRTMNIVFEKSGPILVVILQGRLDASHHQDIRDVVGKEIEATEAKGVVFDLAGLEYISSAGFREFFLLGRQLQRVGGGLAVCSLQSSVQQIFDIAQFQTAYPVCATRDEALVAIGSSLP